MLGKGSVTSERLRSSWSVTWPQRPWAPREESYTHPLPSPGPEAHSALISSSLKQAANSVCSNGQKANYGNIPILTGRRMDFVTRSLLGMTLSTNTAIIAEFPQVAIKCFEYMSSSMFALFSLKTIYPKVPVTRNTGLKSSLLIQFSLYFSMF